MATDPEYKVDLEAIEAVKRSKPWLREPMYMKKVKLSAVAAMKMTTHASTGVDKGLNGPSGMPIEVMGLCIGHVDPENPRVLIVSDAYPLPVEGTETQVLADNPKVQQYMVDLSMHLSKTRKELICGWYHSHPFDVTVHSNCFLSATDVGTQLGWQINWDTAEGIPFTAIVVDPLRSVSRGKPEICAYRCYPPGHDVPIGTSPAGGELQDERTLKARWGETYRSYYEVEVEYFMSTISKRIVGILNRDFMWTRILATTPALERETREGVASRIHTSSGAITRASSRHHAPVLMSAPGMSLDPASYDDEDGGAKELENAAQLQAELSVEMTRSQTSQVLKHLLFNKAPSAVGREAAAATAAGGGGGGGGGGR